MSHQKLINKLNELKEQGHKVECTITLNSTLVSIDGVDFLDFEPNSCAGVLKQIEKNPFGEIKELATDYEIFKALVNGKSVYANEIEYKIDASGDLLCRIDDGVFSYGSIVTIYKNKPAYIKIPTKY